MPTTPPRTTGRRRVRSTQFSSAFVARIITGGMSPPQASGRSLRPAVMALAILLLLSFAAPEIAFTDEPATASAEKPKTAVRPANRLAKETSPYLLLHAAQSCRLVCLGRGRLGEARGKEADLSVDRLLELLLVSRHGT